VSVSVPAAHVLEPSRVRGSLSGGRHLFVVEAPERRLGGPAPPGRTAAQGWHRPARFKPQLAPGSENFDFCRLLCIVSARLSERWWFRFKACETFQSSRTWLGKPSRLTSDSLALNH
jgi:hypothetical protein